MMPLILTNLWEQKKRPYVVMFRELVGGISQDGRHTTRKNMFCKTTMYNERECYKKEYNIKEITNHVKGI